MYIRRVKKQNHLKSNARFLKCFHNSYRFILTLLFITGLLPSLYAVQEPSEAKVKIRQIKYLTPEALREEVMLTYLGFQEGESYTEKRLENLIKLAKMRLEEYNVFNNVEILSRDSRKYPGEKIIYIKLTPGFDKQINANLWWFQYGWKNWKKRGDYIGFTVGANQNNFQTKFNLPPGWLFIETNLGWRFWLDNPFFPFYPLYGDEAHYIQQLFAGGRLGFKVHPDITLGPYADFQTDLYNGIKDQWSLSYQRSMFRVGAFFTVDQIFAVEKYGVGYLFSSWGGVNIDAAGDGVFGELYNEFKIDLIPWEYLLVTNRTRLLNQIDNPLDYNLFDINRSTFQRGEVTDQDRIYGDFLFTNNLELVFTLLKMKEGAIENSLGLKVLYDLFFITDNSSLAEGQTPVLEHTLGGGFWFRMGRPINLTIKADFGRTLGGAWSFGVTVGSFL